MRCSKFVYLSLLILLGTSCRPAEPFSAGHFLCLKSNPTLAIQEGRNQNISLLFELQQGMHILAEAGDVQQFSKADFVLQTSPGITLKSVDWSTPSPFHIAEAMLPIHVYKEKLELNLDLQISPDLRKGFYELKGILYYQACDQQKCYFPKELPINLNLKVR